LGSRRRLRPWPLFDCPLQFRPGQLDVIERQYDGTEEPVGRGGTPFIEEIIVVGPDARVTQVTVLNI
jgi:hypothetical protein